MKKKDFIQAVFGFVIFCILASGIPANADDDILLDSFTDSVFRDYISEVYDTDGDGSLNQEEQSVITDVNLDDSEVVSLEGIKQLKNLKNLYCSQTNLEKLDVSGMENLECVIAIGDDIETVDVSGCDSLVSLYINFNSIENLTLENMPALETVWCDNNGMTSFEISDCESLKDLDCNFNSLSEFSASNCPSLESVDLSYNNLSSFTFSNCDSLVELGLSVNPISEIDVSGLSEISYVFKYGYAEYGIGDSGDYIVIDYGNRRLIVDYDDKVKADNGDYISAASRLPSASPIGSFVDRCYKIALGRIPEAAGYNNWVNNIRAGVIGGGQAARGFILSQEYQNFNRTDEQYVTDLYKLFFNRQPDQGGFTNWMNQLRAGVMNRTQVLESFISSQEFTNLCNAYGIRK